ncbi:hypothetical protein J3R30DRAFT_3423556 [Lentinula aciculospora]|uniref:Uncharacterized protein n=1 Tax=Lentinula aciculospora TaxID=153920 RepID=A0A9W9AU60_9AGAR|nr:hypothetical protein J3R30DRAFT_3423556 [Lentinula aciculospora]
MPKLSAVVLVAMAFLATSINSVPMYVSTYLVAELFCGYQQLTVTESACSRCKTNLRITSRSLANSKIPMVALAVHRLVLVNRLVWTQTPVNVCAMLPPNLVLQLMYIIVAVNKHVAVVESSVAALGASVTAMQTTGTLQPAIHGTKELFNKGVQKVNATYHHTTEEVHNVTTSVERKTHKLLHPFSHNDKQEKTYKEEDKDHENYR